MPKGHTNNPNGRPKGSKNSRENSLLRSYFRAFLTDLGEQGFKEWAKTHKSVAIEKAVALEPKQVGLDDPTAKTLADFLKGTSE